MTKRRQEKATIATGGIDSGKEDVSGQVQTFGEWLSEQSESPCDLAERAWKAGRLNLLASIGMTVLHDEEPSRYWRNHFVDVRPNDGMKP